ncbi:hypothetical protein AN958_02894 [Leucoagaricus sp. SymC.cos]|nr:hypothetical protein AN958_02894 [Leucoagaricus sp. SymC.cos]
MAQAVFGEHPLEQYLREAGEGPEVMPGSNAALTLELEPITLSSLADPDDPDSIPENSTSIADWQWRPQLLIYLLQHIETLVATTQLTKPTNPLVERFKYNVISSSLLSPDLSAPYAQSKLRHPCDQPRSIPGNLPHSRTSSELSQAQQYSAIPTSCFPDAAANEAQFGLLSSLVVVFAILLNAGLLRLAVLTLWMGLAGIYYLRVQSHATRLVDLTPCLETLDELISTNNDWENIVQDVITTIEKDERTFFGSSTSAVSTSPASSLRVALHSTLQTTQTQCDNVRHLLSALTSPSDLSQLSEMYAPPSPLEQHFSFHNTRLSKSLSYPSAQKRQKRPTSIPTSPSAAMTIFTDHKRMTWNGSHSNGSFSPSCTSPSTSPAMRRRIKHRSDLSMFFGTSASTSDASASVPITPPPLSPLRRVSEELHDDDLDTPFVNDSLNQSHDQDEGDEEEENGTTSFAAAALKLKRSRTTSGIEALTRPPTPSNPLLSPPRSYPRLPTTNGGGSYIHPISPRLTFVPSSRFTTIHTSRQPLSLSALQHALQAALGAKRYACAHLLALRFREEESVTVAAPTAASMTFRGASVAPETGGSYWDDVKSIMELLIGALSDAASRLCEAMREAEAMRLRDQTPTPVGSIDRITGLDTSPDVRKLVVEKEAVAKTKRLSEMIPSTLWSGNSASFAPMPSHLGRFAGHVAAIQSALEDARGYLQDCVGALNESEERSSLHPPSAGPPEADSETGEEHHPALRAFERLRRELGFALRECERGRSRLIDVVTPLQPLGDDREVEGAASEEKLPALGHDSHSEESDRADGVSPLHSEDGMKDNVAIVDSEQETGRIMDDASLELLLSANTDHLPPAHIGAEQIFETDTSVTTLTPVRPKTKLSREERIKLVKARRESGLGLVTAIGVGLGAGSEPSSLIHDSGGEGGYGEKWGPGGDVVQELKDVIWKVGEKRRKIQSQHQSASQQSQQSLSLSLQCHDEDRRASLPVSPGSSLRSSLDTPNFQLTSSSPLASPRPKRVLRAPLSTSLTGSPRSSMDQSPSLIPRRASLINMRNILASLQKEVSEVVGKDVDEECVLSTE